jgi:hypothetical protein
MLLRNVDNDTKSRSPDDWFTSCCSVRQSASLQLRSARVRTRLGVALRGWCPSLLLVE